MQKALNHTFIFLLIVIGSVCLIGKHHFFLGSLLGILQVPIIIIGGGILWRRRKKGIRPLHKMLGVLIGLLMLNWTYEHIRRVSLPPPTETHQEISLLTYNLFFKNKYRQQIIREIQHTDADILVVQELTPSWNSALEKEVYSKYPYRKTYIHRGTHGLGIFSQYPIKFCEYLKNESGLPVNQISAISINGKALVLVNSHWASPAIAVENPENFWMYYQSNAQERTTQWGKLAAHLESQYPGNPLIIAGDLNTMKIEPLYREIRHSWKDLFAKKGKGLGGNFPNIAHFPMPVITLDYILYRGNVKPIEAKVLEGSSSDHLAIWGKVKI